MSLQTNTVTVTQPCPHLSVVTMSPPKPNTLDYRVLMPRQRQVKGAQRSLQQEGSLSWGPRPVIRQSPWCPASPADLPALGEGRVPSMTAGGALTSPQPWLTALCRIFPLKPCVSGELKAGFMEEKIHVITRRHASSGSWGCSLQSHAAAPFKTDQLEVSCLNISGWGAVRLFLPANCPPTPPAIRPPLLEPSLHLPAVEVLPWAASVCC